MTGRPVQHRDGSETYIRIAFRPLDGTFAVADAMTAGDPEFLSDISPLFVGSRHAVVRDFLHTLRAHRDVDETEETLLRNAIDHVADLRAYHLSTVTFTAALSQAEALEHYFRVNG